MLPHMKVPKNPFSNRLGMEIRITAKSATVGARAHVHLVQQWLASGKNKDWLVILDSLDDLESFGCRDLVP